MTPSALTHQHSTCCFGIESGGNLGYLAALGAREMGIGTVTDLYLLSRFHLSFIPVLGIGTFFRRYPVVHAATTCVQASLLT